MPQYPTNKGYITLATCLIILAITALGLMFQVSSLLTQQKIIKNDYDRTQAFAAAQGGLEFGIAYLEKYSQQIFTSTNKQADGSYAVSAGRVNQTDGTQFAVSYKQSLVGTKLVEVISVGTNTDGSVSRTVSQVVQLPRGILNFLPNTLNVLQAVNFNGNTSIINTQGPIAIRSGGSANLAGSSSTTIYDANKQKIIEGKEGVERNYVDYNNISADKFFSTVFTADKTVVKAQADKLIISSGNNNNDLATYLGSNPGGKLIWVEHNNGELKLNGNSQIGSVDNPVILIINTNGNNLSINGNAKIYGFVYVMTPNWSNNGGGGAEIIGGLAVGGNFNMNGNFKVTYDTGVYERFNNGVLAKLPGSWRDY